MPPVAGVVFDLDGTLGETLPVTFAAFRTVLQRDHGVVYDDHAIRAMLGPSERGVFERHAAGDPDALLLEFLAEYRTHHVIAARPFSGIGKVLDWLAGVGIPMAVVTGKGPESAMLSLRHWGIAGYFEQVLAGGDGGDVKIDNMRTVVAGWGCSAASVVAVGDIPYDVTRAHAAGLRAVSAAWSEHADASQLAEAGPEAVFHTVAEFHSWLEAVSDPEPRHGSQSLPSGQNVK